MPVTRRGLLAGAAALGAWPAGATVQGDTLIIGQTGDIFSLDPAFRTETPTGIVQRHIYDTILNRMPDMSVGPGIARSWRRLDPVTWRLELEEGRRFSNGEPVDGETIRATLARLNAPETRSPLKDLFETLTVANIDGPMVTIVTKGPDALFESRMTNFQLVPPKYTATAGAHFGEAPIGSGPFVLEYWHRNAEVALLANPTYGGAKQRFKRLLFRAVPEEIARISAVRTGAAHLVTSISPNQAASLQRGGEVQILTADSNRTMVVQFNKEVPFGNDPRFRRAVGLAINRDNLIHGLMKDYASPIGTIFGAAVQGVPKDVRGDFAYDPDAARKLIRELGVEGKEIELAGAVGRYPLDRECALAVGGELRKVGLNVKVRTYEYGSFAEDIQKNRVAPIFIQPHGNIWMDPLPQIIAFFYSRGHWSGWRDPVMDSMIDRANTTDGEERLGLVGDLIRKLHDDAIAVPLYALRIIYAAAPGLQWKPRPDDLIIAEEIS